MQVVEEGWKRKWDNYRLSPGESFMFIVREQDCLHTFEDYFSGVTGDLVAIGMASSRVFLPMSFLVDFLQTFFRWLSGFAWSLMIPLRGLISSEILPIIMLLAVVNDQKESWFVTHWVEALLWTKIIAGVHPKSLLHRTYYDR
jgi:hypothetical protein